MEIYVTDPSGEPEFVGNSREELLEDLYRTAADGYTLEVMNWFDGDHSQPFKIENGRGTDDQPLFDVWEAR